MSIEVSLTVGKLDASLALLTTQNHHVIEFPTVLLPDNVKAGSIVKIQVTEDLEQEAQERLRFAKIQDKILAKYGTHEPKAPKLRLVNVTQTSCVLEWDALEIGSSQLLSLVLFKQDSRALNIPNPMNSTSTKISGLSIDTDYEFQLKMSTTSGKFWSNQLKVRTHKMTDMSGITVCLGPLVKSGDVTKEHMEVSLKAIGAKPLQKRVSLDTTHFVCNDAQSDDKELARAKNGNIPVVRPEWIRACELEKRIVGVRGFYLDVDSSTLESYRFVDKGGADSAKQLPGLPETSVEKAGPSEVKQDLGSTADTNEHAEPSENEEDEEEEAEEEEAEEEAADVESVSLKDEAPFDDDVETVSLKDAEREDHKPVEGMREALVVDLGDENKGNGLDDSETEAAIIPDQQSNVEITNNLNVQKSTDKPVDTTDTSKVFIEDTGTTIVELKDKLVEKENNVLPPISQESKVTIKDLKHESKHEIVTDEINRNNEKSAPVEKPLVIEDSELKTSESHAEGDVLDADAKKTPASIDRAKDSDDDTIQLPEETGSKDATGTDDSKTSNINEEALAPTASNTSSIVSTHAGNKNKKYRKKKGKKW
ncbi:translation initiation factor eIF4G Ecym_7276 [Eremothecium cymbalariae DBVPG|uniref:Chitin biosynthesis protein CHS5 n=1 Tax=Eremothecium cymbalariae (strain CBS 270.75 / DBVPG 7215 / KCTC 17166 / NRRL Y-17582) TaxID=931890 RepID=G8JWA3_ERECY|nr:hypothetical protein Ecym_7276 [Eremothecium cymbalariae DBVPG\